MEYTVEMADRIAEKLRTLPPMDASKRRLRKQGVVQHLAREIAALQDRGYTLDQVAESLRGEGLEIATPTLKSYLQRSKQKRGGGGRKAPPAPTGQTAAGPAPVRHGAAREAPKGASAETTSNAPKSTKREFVATDRQKL
jgi:hypothetical protein